MSGKWAKACDRWSGEYGLDRDWDFWSASLIVEALASDDIYGTQMRCVEVAGMHIRTWRKSLGKHNDIIGRRDVPDGIGQERLLWMALSCVAYSAGTDNPVWEVRNLRQAEANLRTWWKRAEER